jgi:hypothetical protein
MTEVDPVSQAQAQLDVDMELVRRYGEYQAPEHFGGCYWSNDQPVTIVALFTANLGRAIDEAMGHRDHRAARAGGSAIGSRYRHTTPETEARIRAAINGRLTTAVDTATRLAAQAQLTPAPAGTLTAPRRPRHAKRAAS